MPKSKLTFTLSISLLINLIFSFYSFSQNSTTEEIMTFETYYPAPFGVYNEMRAKRMAVGDTYINGSAYSWDTGSINADADLVVEGNVGIGTTNPSAPLHISRNLSGNLMKLDAANAVWKIDTIQKTGPGGNVPFLRLRSDVAGGLDFLISSSQGQVAIWPAGEPLRYSPFGGISSDINAFSVWGDLVVGDIHHHVNSDPDRSVKSSHHFMRLYSPDEPTFSIPTAYTTNLYSNAFFNEDFRGGAGITLVPITNGSDDGDDGYVQLFAFGKGNGPNSNSIRFSTRSGVDTVVERMRITGTGSVGIGTTSFFPTTEMHIKTNGISSGPTNIANADMILESGVRAWVMTSQSPSGNWILNRDEAGSLEVIRAHPNGDVDVAGTLTAGQKSFEINHPVKPGWKLVHASLEGPEVSVFYRGEAKLENGMVIIELPEYFEALTRKERRTVILTAKGDKPYLLSSSEVIDGKFNVYGTRPDGEFYWEVKAMRADVELLKAEKKI